jgi:hypothetical protein
MAIHGSTSEVDRERSDHATNQLNDRGRTDGGGQHTELRVQSVGGSPGNGGAPYKEKSQPISFQDQWVLFEKARSSNDPADIYRGITAQRQCAGLQTEDTASIVSEATAAIGTDKKDAELRLGAANSYAKGCAGFSRQDVVADVQQMWERLRALGAVEAKAHDLGRQALETDARRVLRERKNEVCDLLSQAVQSPGVMTELSPALQLVIFSADQALSNPRSAPLRSVVMMNVDCLLRRDCGAWTAQRLTICALSGECSPGEPGPLERGGLVPSQWNELREHANRLVPRLVNMPSCIKLIDG